MRMIICAVGVPTTSMSSVVIIVFRFPSALRGFGVSDPVPRVSLAR